MHINPVLRRGGIVHQTYVVKLDKLVRRSAITTQTKILSNMMSNAHKAPKTWSLNAVAICITGC